jgi:hypothetical protein
LLAKFKRRLRLWQSAALSKLFMLYRSGRTDEAKSRFGIRAAVLQLAAALCDPVYLRQTVAAVLVALVCGLVVMANTDASHTIWIGLLAVVMGVMIGALVSTTICDGYDISQSRRRQVWFGAALLCICGVYLPAKSLPGIDVYWLLFVSLVTVFFIALTEANFGDRWHFERFQKEARPETLQDYLPPNLRGRVIRLKAIDKYTFVLTEKGGYEIRMPLTRAIELCDAPGLSIHRSHWVARHKVCEPSRVGRRWVMTVEGERLPVSGSRLAEVRLYLTGQSP